MIQIYIDNWYRNKDLLENYYRTTPKSEYSNYENIVRKTIELVLNTGERGFNQFDLTKLCELKYGDYSGDYLYIIPKDSADDIRECIYFSIYYGSCSGCDTLEGLNNYEKRLPDEQQIKEYMQLSLNIIQSIKHFE